MNTATHTIVNGVAVSGIVLAGGRGRRVGGADKGRLPLGEATRVEAVIAALAPQVDEILISANRNLGWYRSLGYPVHKDALAGHQGPLAGIATLLPHCAGAFAITCPCDTPQLAPDLAQRLLAPLRADGAMEASLAHDGEREQYAFLGLRPALADNLNGYLQGGGRAVRGWLGGLRVARVTFPDGGRYFENMNRLDAAPG